MLKTTIAMFRLNLFIICLLFITQTTYAQLIADSWKNASEKGEGTIIITYIEAPAFVYKNTEGRLDGICIDLLKEFVNFIKKEKDVKINVVLQKKNDDFNQFLNNIKTAKGGVFGLGPITITEERKKEMYFTPPFINNLSVMISHSSVPDMDEMRNIASTFKGMKAYALKNSTQEQEILDIKKRYYPNLQVVYVSSAVELVTKTLEDPRSFTKIDFLYYADAKKNGEAIKMHAEGNIKTAPLGFIMPYGCDWIPLWYEFLSGSKGFQNNSEYKNILIKHLGSNAANALLGAD